MKYLIITCFFVLSFFLNLKSQVSEETAKAILGDHFIALSEAKKCWLGLDSALSLPETLTIAYSEEYLNEAALRNKQGLSDYYLLPLLGLGSSALKKFWLSFRILEIEGYKQKSQTTYLLINFKGDRDSMGFFCLREEYEKMEFSDLKPIRAFDYFEALATVSLLRGKNKAPNYEWFFVDPSPIKVHGHDFQGEKVLLYTAYIGSGLKREVYMLYLPAEMKPMSLYKNKLSFSVREANGVSLYMSPLEPPLSYLDKNEKKSYGLGFILSVKTY